MSGIQSLEEMPYSSPHLLLSKVLAPDQCGQKAIFSNFVFLLY